MRPENLDLLHSISAPSVSPDGEWALVSTSRPNFDVDSYTGQLWRVPLTHGEPRRITRGQADRAPQISPDGTTIGFLRADAKGHAQIFLMPALELGEAIQITDAPLGVSSFAFAPDSWSVAYQARVPELGRYGTLDGVDARHEDGRVLTDRQFQANGLGYTGDRRTALFVVQIPDLFAEPWLEPTGRRGADGPAAVAERAARFPSAERLTHDDVDYGTPVWALDGSAVYAVAARHEGADADLISDLWRIPVVGGEPERVTDGTRSVDEVVETSAGLFVLAAEMGESRRDFIGRDPGVFVVEGEHMRRLTDVCDHVGSIAAAGDDVLALSTHRGAQRLTRVAADGTLTVLADGFLAHSAAAVPGGDEILLAQSDLGELVVRESDGSFTRLTDFNGPLLEASPMVPPQDTVIEADDGYPVHGWVLTPEGEGPFPTLLLIHGGPFADYHQGFFDEAQVYVEAGYGVIMCNPRGALGYGEAHGRAIRGDMGNRDMRDILAFFEGAMAAHPEFDRERIGIMGGSYGGYMTAWIISRDHRFRGAIVERGFLDGESFEGASDIGWFFQSEYMGEDLEAQRRQSPMSYVDQVTTPTMVIHSEEDIRCPIAQGYRYYARLLRNGVTTRMLAFPGENHELTRSGSPWHRRQRFDEILRWWSERLS